MKIDIKKLKPAPYNPRKLSEHHYNGLKNSIDKFGDISGITWNQRTGHLIAGHQRFMTLKNQFHDIYLEEVIEGKARIMSKESGYIGFDVRVVDWDEITERAANITANNHAIGGEWDTELLHTLLDEARSNDAELFKNLNLDILEHDMRLTMGDDGDWKSDIDGLGKISGNLDGLKARIIIECEPDLKDEVLIYIKAKLLETSFEGVHVK